MLPWLQHRGFWAFQPRFQPSSPQQESWLLFRFASTFRQTRSGSGAASAPHSRVVWLARVLPAGAPPHLPRERHTGHTRGWDLLLDQERLLETPSTGRAAPGRCCRRTGASAVRAAWGRISRNRDNIATVWYFEW